MPIKKGLCFAVVMLVLSGVTPAQTSTPPVKMGLWQTTNISTMTGFQIPPEVAARLQAMGKKLPTGQPQTTVTQSCLTTEKWQKMFTDMQQNRNCQLSNQHQTSAGFSADMACRSTDGRHNSTGHIQVNFVSEEKMQGKVHVEVISESQPKPIVMDMSFDSAYHGDDCKGVSPDLAKTVR